MGVFTRTRILRAYTPVCFQTPVQGSIHSHTHTHRACSSSRARVYSNGDSRASTTLRASNCIPMATREPPRLYGPPIVFQWRPASLYDSTSLQSDSRIAPCSRVAHEAAMVSPLLYSNGDSRASTTLRASSCIPVATREPPRLHEPPQFNSTSNSRPTALGLQLYSNGDSRASTTPRLQFRCRLCEPALQFRWRLYEPPNQLATQRASNSNGAALRASNSNGDSATSPTGGVSPSLQQRLSPLSTSPPPSA